MAQKPKEDQKGYALLMNLSMPVQKHPIAFAIVFVSYFVLQLNVIEAGLESGGLTIILIGLIARASLLGWIGAKIVSELKKQVNNLIGMLYPEDQLIQPSSLRDIPVGIIKVWWTWIIAVIGIGLFYNAYTQEWNFPWLPLGVAIFMLGYGVYKTLQFKTSITQHYEYMVKYGLKRQAMMFKCNLCGAVFHQPEGADLCPECYESGIVEIEV